MKKKIICILVMTLLIAATVLPVAGNVNVGKNKMVNIDKNQDLNHITIKKNSEKGISLSNINQNVNSINVEITKPKGRYLYIFDREIIPIFLATIILGSITIEVGTSDKGIDKVEFYIDNKLKKTVSAEPFTYKWRPFKLFKHTIKVVAYNKEGYYAEDEIKVW